MDEIFDIHTWYNEGDPEATDNNSVLNKDNMNDLENRIKDAIKKIQDIFSNSITFGTATRHENLKGGGCVYVQIGKLVIVRLSSVTPNARLTGESVLFTGLPEEKSLALGIITGAVTNDSTIIAVRNSSITVNYDVLEESADAFGIIWYEAKE